MNINFVTPGPWGAGLGRPLDAAEVDVNFHVLAERVEAIEAAPSPTGRGIESVTLTGSVLTVRATDGAVLYTGTLPVPNVNPRGVWVAGATYQAGDVAVYRGVAVMATVDHTASADWWTDQRAGRWRTVAGAAAPSPTAVGGGGAVSLEVPPGIAFATGMAVSVQSDADASVRLVGNVTAYAEGAEGRWWLDIEVSGDLPPAPLAGWLVTPGAASTDGGGGGWSRMIFPASGYVVSEVDAGALVYGSGTVTLPDPETVPVGTRYHITGWELTVSSVPDVYSEVIVDNGDVLTVTAAGDEWVMSRADTSYGGWRTEHVPDMVDVLTESSTLVLRNWYSPGWDAYYGTMEIRVETSSSGDEYALFAYDVGAGHLALGEGVGVGWNDPGPGLVSAGGGYQVAGAALALRHLADVADPLSLAAGYGLRHDGTTMVATALPTATDGDGIPYLPEYAVASLPAAAAHAGGVVRVSNGDAGAPCLAVSDGTDWRRVPLGAAVAAI